MPGVICYVYWFLSIAIKQGRVGPIYDVACNDNNDTWLTIGFYSGSFVYRLGYGGCFNFLIIFLLLFEFY